MPVSLIANETLEAEVYNVSISRDHVTLLHMSLMIKPQGQGNECHIGRNLASERQKVESVPQKVFRLLFGEAKSSVFL